MMYISRSCFRSTRLNTGCDKRTCCCRKDRALHSVARVKTGSINLWTICQCQCTTVENNIVYSMIMIADVCFLLFIAFFISLFFLLCVCFFMFMLPLWSVKILRRPYIGLYTPTISSSTSLCIRVRLFSASEDFCLTGAIRIHSFILHYRHQGCIPYRSV